MKLKKLRTLTATGAIALSVLAVAPRQVFAQFSTTPLDPGTTEGGDTSGVFSTGGFSLDGVLNNLGNVGTTVGTSVPDLGNLSALGALNSLGSISGCTTTGIAGGTIDLGNCSGALSTVTGLPQSDITKATTVVNGVKGINSSISAGNVGGVLSGLKGILGAFGIIDPQQAGNASTSQGLPPYPTGTLGSDPNATATAGTNDASGSIDPNATSPGVPAIKDAQSPSQSYFLSNVADTTYRSALENIAKLTLGSAGQKQLASQSQEASLALSQSQNSQQSLADELQQSVQSAQASVTGSKSSAQMAQTAQQAQNSQDVLKQMSGQMAIGSQQSALTSGQLSLLSSNQYQIGTQLVALQAQEKLHSDQLRILEVTNSAELDAQTQISNLANRQLLYDQGKEYQNVISGAQSFSNVFVPGLVASP